MIRTPRLAATWLLAAALPALAASPAATQPAAPGVPLRRGDSVSFDLSALPERLEGEAVASCVGTRIAATGPEEARCERSLRFEIGVSEVRMAFAFKATAGGQERRIDLPITRERKPVFFVAPADGTLAPPAPTVLPPEEVELAAKRAAAPQCGECRGGRGFRLDSVKVTRQPLPPGGELPVRIRIVSPPK